MKWKTQKGAYLGDSYILRDPELFVYLLNNALNMLEILNYEIS